MTSKTLIALATAWGPRHGGINSFNRDLLRAFGVAYRESVRVICLVPLADEAAWREAEGDSVDLRTLRNPLAGERLEAAHAAEIVECLRDVITSETVWLGHDSFTGAAALEAARQTGTKAAVIHHMSYAAYKGFQSGSSQKAQDRSKEQHAIFSKADHRLAVGPLLRDELRDLVDTDNVHMLIPGLPEIDLKPPPNRWTVLLFGRLDPESDRIKQGRLGVAAFAATYKDALSQPGLSPVLRDRPRLKLYGIEPAEETELREFAGQQAEAALDFHALPFLEDRKALFDDLAKASVALMPSWHEGFGLTGWEAIGAGVPLIMSRQSGLHRFLQEEMAGAGTAYAVDIRGKEADTPYQDEDVSALANAIKRVAAEQEAARRTALKLRELLADRTWTKSADSLALALGWTRPSQVQPAMPASPAPLTQASVLQGGLISQPRPSWQADRGYSYSLLLRAEEACVPFDKGRDEFLAGLLEWVQGPSKFPLALRLLIGPGGVGKTRLLIEACQRLEGGWQSGFLESGLTANDIKRLLPAWLRQHNKTLIVVDYAETRSEQLVALVEAAQAAPDSRLRVVLLARAAGDWWDRLPSRNSLCEAVFNGYATSGPYALPPLHEAVTDRGAAFLSAWNAFAQRLTLNVTTPPQPDLSAEHYSSPLYLQMAALLALTGERADTPRRLLDAVLIHEGHYWRRLGETLGLADGEPAARHLLALATLSGGIATAREAWSLYQSSAGPTLSKTEVERLFLAICPLYPGRQGLQPVRPDLLGESLVARALTLDPNQGEKLLGVCLGGRASEAARRHTLTVLTRLTQHRPDMVTVLTDTLTRHFASLANAIISAGLETGEPLPSSAVSALERLKPNERQQVVGLLERSLPGPTVKLANLALKVAEYRVDFARRAYERKAGLEQRRTFISTLNELGARQLELAQYEAAQSSHRLALQLIQGASDSFLEMESRHQGNLGFCMQGLGRHEEAYSHALRALVINERLAAANPDRYEPSLAKALNNLGNHLDDLGRIEEAAEHAQRALKIREHLNAAHPGRFESVLASSLNNVGKLLSDLGSLKEGAEHAHHALMIFARLAKEHPDRHEPDLARSLSNMGSHLSELGRMEEAVDHAKQALVIHERLTAAHPDRYEPNLAVSYVNMSSHLADQGKTKEATEYARRALLIFERLATERPERYEPDLAMSLGNMGIYMCDLGRLEEATEHAKRALNIYESLAKAHPGRYESDLAMSLGNMGVLISSFGDYLNAQHVYERSLSIYQRLAERLPSRYSANLITQQNEVALLSWIGRQDTHVLPVEQEMDRLLSNVLAHRHEVLSVERAYTLGCLGHETNPAVSLEHMQLAETRYNALLVSQRRQLREIHVVATAYLAKYTPSHEKSRVAREAYEAFASPRQGRLPQMLLDTLDRLDCSPV